MKLWRRRLRRRLRGIIRSFIVGGLCMRLSADYERIIAREWSPQKIVVRLMTNSVNCAG
jgi:hypothetical protein